MKCKNCIYWTNYQDRVFASIEGSITRGIIELRPCEFRPFPNVEDVSYRYTDENNTCVNGHPYRDNNGNNGR